VPARARHPFTAVVVAVLAAAVALSGCTNRQASVNRRPQTGASTASTVDGVQTVTVRAGSDYRFAPSTITVHPGKVRIVLLNTGSGAPHNWTLLGLPDVATPTVGATRQGVVQFTAPAPGTYTFVCTIHQRQGQTGTLVVLPG
jgi:outer membrane autotransporter protein